MDYQNHMVNFSTYLAGLRARALADMIQPDVIDAAFNGLMPLADVLKQDANQSEFSLTLAAYLTRALPAKRISKGRAMVRKHRALLNRIEAEFNVGAEFIVAIWGIETDFGRTTGAYPVVRVLATLAYQNRRRAFFESELFAALHIAQNQNTPPQSLLGSWAGAMGHGQFMPRSYLHYAVDFDNDGRADIWQTDPADGLASIANYLARHGWQNGASWGGEVHLPDAFEYSKTGLGQTRSLAQWVSDGVTAKSGNPVADYGPASLLLPEGAAGPAFLTFGNFDVLMQYNRALAYGLVVGFFADAILGEKVPAHEGWPRTPPLDRAEIALLQGRLNAMGLSAGNVDGLTGPDTQNAVRQFQQAHDLPADGYASRRVLRAVQDQQG